MEFLVDVNVRLLLPILIAGVIFHVITTKCSSNLISISWGAYTLLASIGTPVHELSHLIMAVIFRFKITDVKLFRPIKGRVDGKLGYVSYSYNKNSLINKIGQFFVGVAPMFGGSLVIYLLFKIMLKPLYIALKTVEQINVNKIVDILRITDYNKVNLVIFMILAISIAVHMSISRADLQGAIYGVIWLEATLCVVSFILNYMSITVNVQCIQTIIISILSAGLVADLFALIITYILKGKR